MLTIVEKVLFLQDADIFENITTENLSYIAAITEQIQAEKGQLIYSEGDVSDSMFVVIEGSVRLYRNSRDIMIAQTKDAFGTWALFDDAPRVASAMATEDVSLLRIDRDDFLDLLSDHPRITQSILKTLSNRLRMLLSSVQGEAS